jgi:hypothetical protein
MIDETTAAIIGVAGALVGVILSGIVQRLLARLDRRIEARSAARILSMRLVNARTGISDLIAYKSWDALITDWKSFGKAWDKNNAALARVLGTDQFLKVAATFESIESLAQSRKLAETHAAVFPPDDRLEGYLHDAEVANLLVLKAAYTVTEKLTLRDKGVRAEKRRLKAG